MTMDEATRAQVDAADPHASTWLAANAGSGKTRVLTDRVARLLLAGTDPQNILCLTYTKAAASEMQNRLFRRLGEWAMMPGAELRDALTQLGIAERIDADYLARARRLFAAAIETPGGLKIQTIHSFCAGILRRFPLEAGVSPQFREMEDHETDLLRNDILEAMAEDHDTPLVDALARQFTGAEIAKLLKEITGQFHAFPASTDLDKLGTAFGVSADISVDDLIATRFTSADKTLLARWAEILKHGASTEAKAAVRLAEISPGDVFDPADLDIMESVFLYASGAKAQTARIDAFPNKPTRAAHPELCDALNNLMQRVEDTRAARLRCGARDRTMILHHFAEAFVRRYTAEKQRRGVLDFDDLIHRTRALLTDPAVAQWVLFRLDGGVDHILVDEAQDTSPAQWAVIDLLTQEFTSGQGASADRGRTIFVVGDRKQSIYSFQGADPEHFSTKREEFGTALADIGQNLRPRELLYSFRSSSAILSLVDRVFVGATADGVDSGLTHLPFHPDQPGRVDLWPALDKAEQPQPDWDDPTDYPAASDHEIDLARRIATEIGRMIREETLTVRDNGTWVRRPITPGDFLILVRRRSRLFTEIIAACKAAGLAIAGADRMRLGDDLGVRDILSCLRFLALPEDDLSLAEALKSPIFGWSEADLYAVAQGRPRGQSLWEALRQREADFPDTLAVLHDLRDRAEFLRPYDLINRILLAHDGRSRMIARLGHQAEDGIDALLAQSLAYERSAVPSLTGFLAWFDAEDIQIKRQMDSAGDRIRVMTVHGAKGLEAPIVLLPDTSDRIPGPRQEILTTGPVPVWKPRKDADPPEVAEMRAQAVAAESREFRRLLYVALTRAESWLIVAGAGKITEAGENWYHMVRDGLDHLGAVEMDSPTAGPIRRFEVGNWNAAPLKTDSPQDTDTAPLAVPDSPVAAPDPAATTLAPSDLGGAKALPGDDDEDENDIAKARGRIIHTLSETLPTLPPADRAPLAQTLVARHADRGLVPDAAALIDEVLALLSDPDLAEIFEDGLAEMDITATLPALDYRRIHGAIDRLLVTETEVLAVDLKSNRAVPDHVEQVPVGLRRQMAAYRDALVQVYPDRPVRTALLWTRTGTLMPLPDDMLTRALAEVGTS